MLQTFKVSYRAAVKSVLLTVMFSNTLFQKKKIVLILGSILFAPHLTRQRKFYAAFFFQIAGIPQGRDLELTLASSYIYVAQKQARFVSLATFKATDTENKRKPAS